MQTLGQLSRLEQAKVGEAEEGESPLNQAEKQRRIVVYALNATLLAGLSLALVYLGGRVLETRAAAKTSAPQAPATVITSVAPAETKPAALPVTGKSVVTASHATVIVPVAQQTSPLKRYAGPMIEPKPGERYLQIGAYGPTFTHAFVEELKGQGFHPVVAVGPTEDVYRVMIGPLDAASMERTQAQVEQAGISGTMPRRY